MKKALVTGANGQLGSELKALFDHNYLNICETTNIIFTDIDTLNLSEPSEVESYLQNNKFDYIINCAAYTNVDKAESEKNLAFKINSEAVKNILLSLDRSTKFIHISTDYVFDGNNNFPYTEDMSPNPTSVYGESKMEGETHAQEHKNSIIIRTSWLYSSFGNNFAKSMLKYSQEREELKVVFDQIGTPTLAKNLAEAILQIISQSINKEYFVPGIYHYSNEGVCSWYDFAKAIVDKSNTKCKVNPIESKDYPTPVKRPFYSVLNKHKIKSTYNIEIPHWTDSLNIFFNDLQK
ncbi:MAG: dTDP-4-dehydrorhamnose reductase [Bacteroidales bacterium]|nr:dTDP-4-dehydrorhamnose reductase [Bacteroidales bacterium]